MPYLALAAMGSQSPGALDRVMDLARNGVGANIVSRQLISLDDGSGRPALGMFLAAGALADILLFCRHKLYPLGIPNGLAHALTVVAGVISVVTDWSSRFLPPKPRAIRIQVGKHDMQGRFQVLMVTTLRRLVLSGKTPAEREGTLQLLAIERRRRTVLRAVYETLLGRMGRKPIPGLHLRMGDQIRIEDDTSGVIMDGELFVAAPGKPLVLKPTQSVRFLDLRQSARAAEPVASEFTARPQHRQPAAALLSDAG